MFGFLLVSMAAFGLGYAGGFMTPFGIPKYACCCSMQLRKWWRIKADLNLQIEDFKQKLDKANKRVKFYQHRHREIVKAASEIQGLADKVELDDETGFTEDGDADEEEEYDRSMIIAFNSQDPYGGNFS